MTKPTTLNNITKLRDGRPLHASNISAPSATSQDNSNLGRTIHVSNSTVPENTPTPTPEVAQPLPQEPLTQDLQTNSNLKGEADNE